MLVQILFFPPLPPSADESSESNAVIERKNCVTPFVTADEKPLNFESSSLRLGKIIIMRSRPAFSSRTEVPTTCFISNLDYLGAALESDENKASFSVFTVLSWNRIEVMNEWGGKAGER